MKNTLLFTFMFLVWGLQATTYHVGTTRSYPTPNSLYLANVLLSEDTILIDAETFTGTAALAVWNKDNLVIRGVGGRPRLNADGQFIFGKGTWVLSGDNIMVENVEFFGATVPDKNGAGIRLDGIGLTVRHCYFHDNENGILTNNTFAGDILIEHTEFEGNGHGDGFSHNLYIGHCNKLIFQYNYSHHADIGHNLKSRADENYILYNRIMDEATGNSSRLVDIPNGGRTVMMGNLLMQGPQAPNKNMVGYGLEELTNPEPHDFYFINNTLVNHRTASGLFLHIQGGTQKVKIANNIFAGTGDLYLGPSIAEFVANENNTTIDYFQFVDEPNYDYRVFENSPIVDAGMPIPAEDGIILTPEKMYLHPVDVMTRAIMNTTIDIGAYEWEATTGLDLSPLSRLIIYPNPVVDQLFLKTSIEIHDVCLLDLQGQQISCFKQNNFLDLSGLESGVYVILVQMENGQVVTKSIWKE